MSHDLLARDEVCFKVAILLFTPNIIKKAGEKCNKKNFLIDFYQFSSIGFMQISHSLHSSQIKSLH